MGHRRCRASGDSWDRGSSVFGAVGGGVKDGVPLNVFIVHSESDAGFAERLSERLSSAGVRVWSEVDVDPEPRERENVLDRVTRSLDDIDVVVAVISRALTASSTTAHELSTWMLREALGAEPVILPVLIEECEVPSILSDHPCFDFREDFELSAELLAHRIDAGNRREVVSGDGTMGRFCQCLENQLERLHVAFARGKLTLFCGAGVSISAGIPGWKVFLRSLLSGFFEQTSADRRATAGFSGAVDLAKVYQDYFDLSPIIVAQYLKNALGRDFQRTVRDALYVNDPTSSPLIESLCELCRPQRERPALHGIVNFNFDDLIEQELERNKIRYQAIFAEGQRAVPSELPIFHVHGFLPHDHEENFSAEIVFSEDAYHSKFIDPFSWSNLTQLNQLNQNTCLFVGLGMTDPNLRRLLDVAMRKNPEKSLDHYIFKKRYSVDELACHMSSWDDQGGIAEQAQALVRTAEILEERDCNNLGLNVIWVESFDQIPECFHKIAEG